MITIIGGSGNMGRRYGKILQELGERYQVIDFDAAPRAPNNVSKLIITTPTDCHFDHIFAAIHQDIPILCEKPITRFEAALKALESWERAGVNLQMVDQYAFCPRYHDDNPLWKESTVYASWHSGDDTLPWDCINILAKAHDLNDVSLSNKQLKGSWYCRINGEKLKLEDMNDAYKAMIIAWLDDHKPNYEYMRHAHTAVLEYKKLCQPST